MEHFINISTADVKTTVPLSEKFSGKDPEGNEISFNSYFMELNGSPFFGISGECHYARVDENQWEDTILKMKMGGLNIIATYIFWIHHEEVEGKFRFDGSRNVRKFLELCKKHGMYVIVRIGPFCHGEVRNGGLPDWLYGKPFEVRTLDEGFLKYVRRLYQKLGEQFAGLYFKDGGPIIGTQLDNEFMHCGAPWEITTGVSNERTCAGEGGDEYMLALKHLAQEAGIITPFYTCTGWGSPAPTEEMLPLWGGYAYWPWMFANGKGEHPVTDGYLYRDYHNRELNGGLCYDVESVPYACCEMGGGMSCFYHYRFQLPFESVDAMANVKLASGCNFLGYYVYRGGSNPKGETTPYLNEFPCPKISYDYQACIGEYGQLRPSYHRLKALHIFLNNFREQLCGLITVLPENASELVPENTEKLRYAVRTDGKRGFLFLNNFQDHVENKPKYSETICIQTKEGQIRIPDISLAAGEEAVLPFSMDVGGYCLQYAKAQPLTVIRREDRIVYFFFAPEGMEPEYVWKNEGICSIDGRNIGTEPLVRIAPLTGEMSSYTMDGLHGKVEIVTLTRQQSLQFYEILVKGQKTAVLCDSALTFDGGIIHVESPVNDNCETKLLAYPPLTEAECRNDQRNLCYESIKEGIFEGLRICWSAEGIREKLLEPWQCGMYRYLLRIPEGYADCKDVLLQIDYLGDIGNAFADGAMIADNFCNNAVWEIGLKEVLPEALTCGAENEITLLITPLKEGVRIDTSEMAGQNEVVESRIAVLKQVRIKPVLEAEIVLS